MLCYFPRQHLITSDQSQVKYLDSKGLIIFLPSSKRLDIYSCIQSLQRSLEENYDRQGSRTRLQVKRPRNFEISTDLREFIP